jgi:hypothetical protein
MHRPCRIAYGGFDVAEVLAAARAEVAAVDMNAEPVLVQVRPPAVDLRDGSQIEIPFSIRVQNRGTAPSLELVKLDQPKLTGPPFDQLRSCARSQGALGFGFGGALLGCLLGPLGCAAGASLGAAVGDQAGEDAARSKAFQNVNDQLKTQLGDLNTKLATSSGVLITQKVDDGLREASLGLTRLRAPFALLGQHPDDTLAVRLGDEPRISPGGIVLSLCAHSSLGGPKLDPSLAGPLDLESAPPAFTNDLSAAAPTVELRANADGLNQLLYFLWQSGALREMGTSASVRQALPRELEALAFEFGGFDPGLPPTVTPAASHDRGIGLALGDVRLGDWDRRRVVAHALGAVELAPDGERVRLSYALKQLFANCTEAGPTGTVFTPCVSDLLPSVREQIMAATRTGASPCETTPEHPYQGPPAMCIDGGPALTTLTEKLGGLVQLSRLKASTEGNPIRVTLGVEARIGPAIP